MVRKKREKRISKKYQMRKKMESYFMLSVRSYRIPFARLEGRCCWFFFFFLFSAFCCCFRFYQFVLSPLSVYILENGHDTPNSHILCESKFIYVYRTVAMCQYEHHQRNPYIHTITVGLTIAFGFLHFFLPFSFSFFLNFFFSFFFVSVCFFWDFSAAIVVFIVFVQRLIASFSFWYTKPNAYIYTLYTYTVYGQWIKIRFAFSNLCSLFLNFFSFFSYQSSTLVY